MDGVYSEYGQSEYDPVVPGGTMTDGMLSEAGSSARYTVICALPDVSLAFCKASVRSE